MLLHKNTLYGIKNQSLHNKINENITEAIWNFTKEEKILNKNVLGANINWWNNILKF